MSAPASRCSRRSRRRTTSSRTPLADLTPVRRRRRREPARTRPLRQRHFGLGLSRRPGIAGRYKAWDISGRVGVTGPSVSDYGLSDRLPVRHRLEARHVRAGRRGLPRRQLPPPAADAGRPQGDSTNILRKPPHPLSIGILPPWAISVPAGAQQVAESQSIARRTTRRSPYRNRPTTPPRRRSLEEIVVTGTLIPSTTNSGMSPVLVITSEDMAAKGLVYRRRRQLLHREQRLRRGQVVQPGLAASPPVARK